MVLWYVSRHTEIQASLSSDAMSMGDSSLGISLYVFNDVCVHQPLSDYPRSLVSYRV